METSENINEIVKALSVFQANVGNIAKDKKGYNYKYADISAVLKEVRPVLSKNEMCISQFTETNDKVINGVVMEYVTVTTLLAHSKGQWFKSSIKACVNSNQGKMANIQAIGSITTYLRRYSLSSMLGIATDDDTDGAIGDGKISSAQAEVQSYKDNINGLIGQLTNKSIIKWFREQNGAAKGVDHVKRLYTGVCWQTTIESKMIEIQGLIKYISDESAEETMKGLTAINNSRISNITNDVPIKKLDEMIIKINSIIDEMNG